MKFGEDSLRLACEALTQRTGVCVLRIWLEDGEQDVLRARITETLDISRPDEIERAAAEAKTRFSGQWVSGCARSSMQPRRSPRIAAPRRRAGPSRCAIELLHQLRRLDPELLSEQAAAEPVLAQRLDGISLEEVNPNERAVGALPQRFDRQGGVADFGRFSEPPRAREALAEHVERPETQVAEPLPLEQHPVVVPVRKQVAEQKRRRVGADEVRVALIEDMPRAKASAMCRSTSTAGPIPNRAPAGSIRPGRRH